MKYIRRDKKYIQHYLAKVEISRDFDDRKSISISSLKYESTLTSL